MGGSGLGILPPSSSSNDDPRSSSSSRSRFAFEVLAEGGAEGEVVPDKALFREASVKDLVDWAERGEGWAFV